MNKPRRKSRQRKRILEIITEDKTHPTAQSVYDSLRKEGLSVSLGNVYRNIRILVEDGFIKCRDFGDGIERFDAIVDPHYHFICEQCKTVTDLFMPLQNKVMEAAEKMSRHTITGHSIQFFGICDRCKTKK